QVVCRVYGHETRPSNRSIVFETTYVTRQLYGPEYRLESWANPGEPRVSGMPHMEADAYCTKKVLIDGVVVESQKVADDHYVPERQIIKIGCNTLDLYVKPDPSGFGYDKIYDRDNNQLLVNKEGVPFYNGYNGYLLVRDYEADADGHAYLDGNGRPIARTTPLPPTPTQPDVLRLPDYRGRYDVDAYKAELEAMGMTVLDVRYVTSSKPVGEIRMVVLSDGSTQVMPREEIQKGTEFIIMVSSGPSGQTEDPTDPAPTDPAPTDPAPTDPAPTDPAPTDPAPTDPAPTDPAPTDPVPTDPAPTDPAPTNPEGFDVQSVVGMTVKEGTKLLATNGYNYAWPEGEGGPANDSKAIITKVEFINGDPNTVYVYFTE
ncbi:MAG: hypothetical protein J6H18_05605, partial [Lachnospiraceae bacterium]|nr:hypothetical protein [Lachnospiraceae bacterium]